MEFSCKTLPVSQKCSDALSGYSGAFWFNQTVEDGKVISPAAGIKANQLVLHLTDDAVPPTARKSSEVARGQSPRCYHQQ